MACTQSDNSDGRSLSIYLINIFRCCCYNLNKIAIKRINLAQNASSSSSSSLSSIVSFSKPKQITHTHLLTHMISQFCICSFDHICIENCEREKFRLKLRLQCINRNVVYGHWFFVSTKCACRLILRIIFKNLRFSIFIVL